MVAGPDIAVVAAGPGIAVGPDMDVGTGMAVGMAADPDMVADLGPNDGRDWGPTWDMLVK